MKSEVRSQESGVRRQKSTSCQRAVRALVFLLTSVFCLLTSAFPATHVTASYDLGANPRVMTTVSGTQQYGLVFAQRNKAVTYGGVQYGTAQIKGYLDATGQLNDGSGNLWLDLVPNTAAVPGDSFYVVTLNIQGQVHSEIWVVPDQATVGAQLCRQAQPPSSSAPVPFYQLIQHEGAELLQRPKLNFTGSGVACSDNPPQQRTDCAISGGSGTAVSPATADAAGIVKTESTSADPVVYLKTTADSLLAGKANSTHAHAEADVSGLAADLASKAPLAHGHAESEVTGLVTDLAAKAPSTRAVSTSAPLSGGGPLSSDLTLSIATASASVVGAGNVSGTANEISVGYSAGTGTISIAPAFDLSNQTSTAPVKATTAAGAPTSCLANRDLLIQTDATPGGQQLFLCNAAGNGWNKVGDGGGGGAGDVTDVGDCSSGSCFTGGGAGQQLVFHGSSSGAGTLSAAASLSTPAWTLPNTSGALITSGDSGTVTDTMLASNYSGVGSCPAHQFVTADNDNAAPACAQPSTADLSDGSSLVKTGQANTYAAGQKQTFQNSATTAGANLASSADPSSPAPGDLWLNGSALKYRDGAATQVVERQSNKDVAGGYAGLDASTKLNAAEGQEVWSVTDLTDYGSTSGTGSTAIRATITSPAANEVLAWSGTNWINQAPAGGGGDNISVNSVAATDADFDDATPAAPANSLNVKWQKDAQSPNNISAYLPYTAPLTVTAGSLDCQNATSSQKGCLTAGDWGAFNGKPDLVASGTAGAGPSKPGAASTAARSDHDHRSIHLLTWYFPGTPPTGIQNMVLVLPDAIVNPAILDLRVTVNTTSASSSTFNVQRCTANCTGTSPTFADIYSTVLTLGANTRAAPKGAAPNQNVSGLAAGDQFKASLVTLGSGLADVTLTMTVKYETTN